MYTYINSPQRSVHSNLTKCNKVTRWSRGSDSGSCDHLSFVLHIRNQVKVKLIFFNIVFFFFFYTQKAQATFLYSDVVCKYNIMLRVRYTHARRKTIPLLDFIINVSPVTGKTRFMVYVYINIKWYTLHVIYAVGTTWTLRDRKKK